MFFWRAKKSKAEESDEAPAQANADGPVIVAEDTQKPQEAVAAEPASSSDISSKIVTLPKPKLSERLAQAAARTGELISAAKSVPAEAEAAPVEAVKAENAEPIELPAAILPGQERALEALRFGLAVDQPGFNILVTGPSGTGRRTAVRHLLEEHCASAPARTSDWIYVSDGEGAAPMRVFTVPAGRGADFARALDLALDRASRSLTRLIASDDYAIGRQVLEEEFRQTADQAFDVLKRRAEAQNIALVKTPEGYVLAPMHEGRVVKSDVFHALPDSLQKDVETKIIALEGELKQLIAAAPEREAGFAERLSHLNREVGARALHPHMSGLRVAFTKAEEIGLIDGLETHLLEQIAAYVPGPGPAAQSAKLHAHCIPLGAGEPAERRPVVFARETQTADFLGETGRDTSGRVTLRPGHLMRANGGYLVVEAWRLAASPRAWETLSAALETGSVRPRPADGELIGAEALPLSLKVVLIADDASWSKLTALDPGIASYFPAVARFNGTALTGTVDERAYGKLAGAIASAKNVRPLSDGAAAKLREEAIRRAGGKERISLDVTALSQWIVAADHFAAKDKSDAIRAADVEKALIAAAVGAPS